MEGLVQTKLVVENPSDPIYANYPNPPIGMVFLNYYDGEGVISSKRVMVPGTAWTIIALCKYGTFRAIERAKLIGDTLLDCTLSTTLNGKACWFMSNYRWNNTAWVRIKDEDYCETYSRDLFLGAMAFSWLYKKTSVLDYKMIALRLFETAYKTQNDFIDLCSSEFPVYMEGAFPEFWVRTSLTGAFSPANYRAPLHIADAVYDAVDIGIEVLGDKQFTTEGETYRLSTINTRHNAYMAANCINSSRGMMASVNLPYMYMFKVEGERECMGKNLSPITSTWGDVEWISDCAMWGVLGIAKNNPSTRQGFINACKALMIDYFFYDIVNYDGSMHSGYPDFSIQPTIFYCEICRLMGSPDHEAELALKKEQVVSADLNANGLYKWTIER